MNPASFTRPLPRRTVLALVIASVLALGLGVGLLAWQYRPAAAAPIRIGVLHSLSGTMAVSERPLVAAVELAVAEINATGGLLGRPLEVVLSDGRSDWDVFAAEAERLIVAEKVSVLFACWTSACRKAVKPVVEKHHHLMFYPVQYEGLEQSPHILYTGSAPNQQIVPGTRWAMQQFGHRIYLAGSDYVFPRTANLMIRDLVDATGARIVGERYLPLGDTDARALVADIQRQKPSVVLSTLNGDSNAAFFGALIEAGLSDIPLVSFSVAEPEMLAWGGNYLSRHYGVWSYFQSTAGEHNRNFVAAFKARQGDTASTSDPVEAAYAGVRLWAQTVRETGSTDPLRINTATLLRQSFEGPGGIIAVDARTRHLWKRVRVGRVKADGQFEEVFASTHTVRPAPWPAYRTKEEWQALTGVAP